MVLPFLYTLKGANNIPLHFIKEVCDLLWIAKPYLTAYRPQANGMAEHCNRTPMAILLAVVSEQQND